MESKIHERMKIRETRRGGDKGEETAFQRDKEES